MLLLDPHNYKKAVKPLQEVTINNLFARSVVEQKVTGLVYVDDIENPDTFYIRHPYGMSLLIGNPNNDIFDKWFTDYALNVNKVREKAEWLQTFPSAWNKKLGELLGDKLVKSTENKECFCNNKIVENTRVNFRFNQDKYEEFKPGINIAKFQVVRTDKQMFDNMQGSVIPKYFWKDANHFYKSGIGYSIICDNIPVSTAYSAFIHDNKLELGIETVEGYRGKGFAIAACTALIDYCIDNGYEPVWACRLENTVSYKLAQKLGFEPTCFVPYYKLCF